MINCPPYFSRFLPNFPGLNTLIIPLLSLTKRMLVRRTYSADSPSTSVGIKYFCYVAVENVNVNVNMSGVMGMELIIQEGIEEEYSDK